MDYSPLNPTGIAAVNTGRFMFGSFNSSFSLSHHRFLNGRSLGPFGSHPPPYHHSSLPRFAHPSPPHQPPLLPLPDSRSTPPALSPTKRSATVVRSNRRQHQRKPRSPAKPKNGKKAILAAAQKSKADAWGEEEREETEEDAVESIYSISPPPSSLPLPRFSLPRPRSAAPAAAAAAAASCVVEAMEGGGGVVDTGATDGLRRLLRL